MLIKLVALPASAQVYLPKILHILVFHADKGAVVKETLVAMSMFMSCLRITIYQIHSRLTPVEASPIAVTLGSAAGT